MDQNGVEYSKGQSQTYITHILGISQAYLKKISDISLVHLIHFQGKSQTNLMHIIKHISGILQVYLSDERIFEYIRIFE